ncbi:MAG: hypothetical protein H6742_05305 [Alphaproteobacteria bacterium]|nr:hypothetical protein [Alphaproteobacteria bacterium]
MTLDARQLQRLQLLELRACDGLATPAELEELLAAGVDPEALVGVGDAVRSALRPVATPDIAASVMAQLRAEDALVDADVGDALRDALSAPAPDVSDAVIAGTDLRDDSDVVAHALRDALRVPSPDLADAVMAQLGVGGASLGGLLRDALAAPAPELADAVLADAGLRDDSVAVGGLLRDALAAPDIDLADDIMAALDLGADTGDLLRESLAAPQVDVADDVMAALGLADAPSSTAEDTFAGAAEADDDVVVPLARPVLPAATATPPLRRRARWGLPVAGLAAAAVALIMVGVPDLGGNDTSDFELAAINDVQIEDLSTGDDVMVQVYQSDEHAPTIIFIDELEPEGGMPL